MLEKYADQILGAVLTGGGAVLTAALAWGWKRANEWWKRPRVVVDIGSGDGHVYENVLIKNYPDTPPTMPTKRGAIFVRAKVTNKEVMYRIPGKAIGCVGYLAGLERWDSAKSEFLPTKYQDFLRLEWSFNKAAYGIDLLPGVPVWLDVVYVLTPIQEMELPSLKIASNPPVNRYSEGFDLLAALYRVKVVVSGENFGAQCVQFYVLVANGSTSPEVLDETTWRGRLSALEPFTDEHMRNAATKRNNFADIESATA